MQQVIQNIRNGELTLCDVPAPSAQPGTVLIANQASLVSAGTEKMIMDLAKKSLLGKARERPDHVRRVLEKVRNEGLLTTIQQVRKKLDEPMTMGYSSAGVVLACGAGVQNFKPGDAVASNGPHAEFVCVPKNLCAKVPSGVPFDQAAFGVLGSIALQGVRLAQCELGETVFVIGLGLVGQLTVAIAKAAGFRVIGTDPDESKCELALSMGADIAKPTVTSQEIEELTNQLGADAVLITASTKSNAPIELAAEAVRKKGRVVLVGVVGLEIDRRPFFFKEAEFVVSCSYGPGRYDPNYEERGRDYPAHFVRWTEQRNIQAVLDLMGSKRIDVAPLISHRFPISDAAQPYQMIETGEQPYLGIILEYPPISERKPEHRIELPRTAEKKEGIRYGVLGAGNFAKVVLLPAIEKCSQWQPGTICSAKGLTAAHTGKGMGFETACTDEDDIFNDDAIDCVFSITRHDQHARHVIKAIESGKSIFVEKPLCVTLPELSDIKQARELSGVNAPLVMVGFNRRFSPAARKIKALFEHSTEPLTVMIRFNAGEIPDDHWTQDDAEGGGRIIGEACHAIDLATYLTGSPPIRVYCESVGREGSQLISDDQCVITIRHANGSISTIGYFAGGDKAYSKERVEVFGGGNVGVIDDFRSATTVTGGKRTTTKSTMDKGHTDEIAAWCDALNQGGPSPISWDELEYVTLASLMAVQSLREGTPIDLATAFTE